MITQPPERLNQDSTSSARSARASTTRKFFSSASFADVREQLRGVNVLCWLILLAVLVCSLVFAYQTYLLPQPYDYQPNWYGAQWITADTSQAGVVYFRKDFGLDVTPNNAFLMLQVAETATVYVNGVSLGRTNEVFSVGETRRAFIYDLTPFLRLGDNVVAIRAQTLDTAPAALCAVIGLTYGPQRATYPTNQTWRATGDEQVVYPSYLPKFNPLQNIGPSVNSMTGWRTAGFDDSSWRQAVVYTTSVPLDDTLAVDPALYERPLPTEWLSVGSSTDGYFVETAMIPDLQSAWLRIAADGSSAVYLNGQLLIQQKEEITNSDIYLMSGQNYQSGITDGLYNITQYLYQGQNTIAVHVATAPYSFIGQQTVSPPTALSLDILGVTSTGQSFYLSDDGSWRTSVTATANWIDGVNIQGWSAGTLVNYQLISPTQPYRAVASVLIQPHALTIAPVLLCALVLLLFGCEIIVISYLWQRRRLNGLAIAIDRLALGFLPVLGLELLLMIVGNEPLIQKPFPYTTLWLAVVIGVAFISQGLVITTYWLYGSEKRLLGWTNRRLQDVVASPDSGFRESGVSPSALHHLPSLAQHHWRALVGWGVVALGAVLGGVMAFYQLDYEAYWQDELTSLQVAHNILQTGLPHLAGGVIYPKAELYHYELAAVVALFGDNPYATRGLAAVTFLLSLLLMYYVGSQMFGRKVGLLATGLLLFSPFELTWARELRMYQQAQFTTLIVYYLFYRATRPGAQTRYIYLSMCAVVVMYLSFEESFIILPTLLVYFLATQGISWVRNTHWWIAGLSAITIVVAQLAVVRSIQPLVLGTDLSQRPNIGFSSDNLSFYLRLLFDSTTVPAIFQNYQLGVVSAIAVLVCCVAVFYQQRELRYTAVFFVGGFLVLALALSLSQDRYFYPLYPELLLLAAYGVVRILTRLSVLSEWVLAPITARVVLGVSTTLLVVALLASQIPAASKVTVAASRALAIPYSRLYPDYRSAGSYISAHWEQGDALVTIGPSIDGAYYTKQQPYPIYLGGSLSTFEDHGRVLDNYTGDPVLLNKHDLDTLMAKHHRIWILVEDNLYEREIIAFHVDKSFSIVWEGSGVTVYLSDG